MSEGKRPATAVILGAGFSHAAGLPLARNLFDSDVLITSKETERRFERVWDAWDQYRSSFPEHGAELFLSALYEKSLEPESFRDRGLWHAAVQLVGAALGTPRGTDYSVRQNPRYSGRITSPVRVAAHQDFWDIVCDCTTLVSVTSLNYDINGERGLRHRPMKRPYRPGFFYGGFGRPQVLKGLSQPWSTVDRQREVELTGTVPFNKPHGSLNWSTTRTGVLMFQDSRPAFRTEAGPLIIPPVTDKRLPGWAVPVWESARATLLADIWLVCGYSLPEYDLGMRELLKSAAEQYAPKTLILLDPFAESLALRWKDVVGDARVIALHGLPRGLEDLAVALRDAA